ncbi:tetratricopeptide repeat protein [Limnohabitans sp.]|jgi:tetratricopeptide (TPR) repeat protein|uniref:tetratricopeptide repeat protein n=1 Tax=Limnohabitans sp. TaxID=1907725 RepID=UPI0037BF5C5C
MPRLNDVRGLPTTGLNAEQLLHYESLLVDIYTYRPGVQARVDALLHQSPDFVMGHVLRGYALMTDGLRSGVPEARRYLAQAQQLAAGGTERERLHIQTLQAWVDGRGADRLQALESILARWPLDLLAYRQLTAMLFWTGDKRRQLASAMQAVPHWQPDVPGFALTLGPLAFALEEDGRYALAETHAQQALAYHDADLWALHALAHVYEMQGRVREGDATLSAVAPRLKDFNLFRGHVWWHLALFRMAQGRMDEVLDLLDREILPATSMFYLDIQNAASLLARLEIQGVNVGERWERVADSAEQTLGQHLVVFTAPHQAMALARSGRRQALAQALKGFQDDAQAGVEQAQTGAAVSAALALYGTGEYAKFLDLMRVLRYEAASLGASHAQQDLYFQLMVDAALRIDELPLARSLLKERLVKHFSDAVGWQRYQEMAGLIDAASDPQSLRRLLRTGLPQ